MKVEPAVVKHPKTRALARKWNCHPQQVVGFLIELWGYFLEYQPDGNVAGCPVDVLDEFATPCMGRALGTVDTVRQALTEVGFVDPDGRLHDWDDYSGGILAHRAKDRRRKKIERRAVRGTSTPSPASDAVDTGGTSTPRVEQSRVESRVEQQQLQPAAAYATRCVIAVNRVLEDRLAGAWKALVATVEQGTAAEWMAAGIPIQFAERILSEMAGRFPTPHGRQPHTLRYFDTGLREAWGHQVAQAAGPPLTDADKMRQAREQLEQAQA